MYLKTVRKATHKERATLTQERLKELLSYDPDTGLFTRKVAVNYNAKAGDCVGCDSRGYLLVNVDGVKHYLHRLAWLYVHGYMPKEIDHINRDGRDNRISNLREVTRSENTFNQGLRMDNKSGVKGVRWRADRSKWEARVKALGSVQVLGLFDTKEEAVTVRLKAEVTYGVNTTLVKQGGEDND